MKPLHAGEPRQIGRFRLLAELGQGGMGRVLLGVSPDGRLTALKQVHPGLAHDEDFRTRFRREVEASRKVSGAYTAAVMDADPDARTPWLASVFVAGPSLREAITSFGPLPVDAVRYLAAGLASALTEIHRVSLVHRDLKPSNVLLGEDGPRVIDFGIARAIEGDMDLTHTGSIVGSPGFMSPEQAESRGVTSASDMFSLGGLLVMASTGQGPFTGTSTPQTLYNVVHAQPDLRMVPPEIRRLAEPCLAKDPARRPTPAQMLDFLGPVDPDSSPWPAAIHARIAQQKAEVQAILHGPTPAMIPKSPSWQNQAELSPAELNPAQPPKSKKKWVIAACLAVVLLLTAGGVAWSTNFFQGASEQPSAAPSPAPAPTPDQPQELTTARLRVIDPCPLLNDQVLTPLGTPTEPAPGYWGTCTTKMVDTQGKDLSIYLVLGDVTTSEYKSLNDKAGNYPLKSYDPANGSCKVFVETQEKPQVGINLEITYPTGNSCQVGVQLIRQITELATHNPAEYKQTPNTLLTLDPCSLSTPEELTPVIGQFTSGSDQSFHNCRWYGADTNFSLEIRTDNRPDQRTGYQAIDVAGTPMYQYTDYKGSCTITLLHKLTDQQHAETVAFSVVADEAKGITYEAACERAKKAAQLVIPKLPKA